MNGYEYLIARNRLIFQLEDSLRKLGSLPESEREAQRRRLEAQFDQELSALYAQVAEEYPGERKKPARPLADPR